MTAGFDSIAAEYSRGRAAWPQAVLDCVSATIGAGAMVLDLGCGTGISARQLLNAGYRVVGIDISRNMIIQAVKDGAGLAVSFVVGSAGALPFESDRFDAALAFNAFHWFDDEAAVNDIARIVRPAGHVVVVDEIDVGGVKETIKKTWAEHMGQPPKAAYVPSQTWSKVVGDESVSVRKVPYVQEFTLGEAIQYAQSHSWWPRVPMPARRRALDVLGSRLERQFSAGRKLHRNIVAEITVVRV